MRLAITVALLACLPAAAAAQRAAVAPRPVELGVDAALTADFGDGFTTVSLGAPVSRVRAAFFTGGRLAVEPSVAFAVTTTSFDAGDAGGGGDARTTSYVLDADLGVLVHLGEPGRGAGRPGAVESRPYLRPFAGVQAVRFRSTFDGDTDTDGDSRARFGLGLGVRRRVADRLAFRAEGVVARTTAGNDDAESFTRASTTLGLVFGLSFFTR